MATVNKKVYTFVKSHPRQIFDSRTRTSTLNSIYSSKCLNNLNNFITTYYDFAYFILVSPFRFVRDEDGWFAIKTWLPHTVVVAMCHCLDALFLLSNLRKTYPSASNESQQNPLGYFELLSLVFSISFQGITIKRLWFNREDVLIIVNYIRAKSHQLPTGNIKIQSRNFSRLICILFAAMPIYEVINKQILAPSRTWKRSWWNRKLVSEAKFLFFIKNLTESKIIPEPEENLYATDYVLAVIMAIGWMVRFILGFYLDLCLLFAVFTFWTAAYLFAKQLTDDLQASQKILTSVLAAHPGISSINDIALTQKHPRRSKWPEIYSTYQTIRHLTELINSAFGAMLTTYLADSILFHSMSMDAVLVATDISRQIRLLFFICNSTCAFLLSADGCNKLEALLQWLANDENRRDVPLDQMNIVMSELQSHAVGIRGSNIFTITYNLLWHMMTTVVTYFIICIQSRQQQHVHQEPLSANKTLVPDNSTHV